MMFRKLISSLSAERGRAPIGSVPAGQRVYAVGDIHGRLDLLHELLDLISIDDAASAPADTQIIFLGDLIDRGPDSADVVQRLLELSLKNTNMRFLLGNHEEVFLKALARDKGAMPFFLKIGGKQTVLSYGIGEAEYRESDYDQLTEKLRDRVPSTHIEFLNSFEDLIEVGEYAFVHAGVRPGTALADQSPASLRWIREEFLSHSGPMEKIIVHGHTIVPAVEERRWRIGIDTGAYSSGKLTAMAFEGSRRWVLQTG